VHPVLLTIFGHEIHSYQIAYPGSLLLGILLTTHLAKKEGCSEEVVLGGFLFALIGVLIGSRLLEILVRLPYYIDNPMKMLTMRRGVVLYGGYIGAVVGSMGYVKYKKQPWLPLVDIAATMFGLGLFIQRAFGCFMAGCCYGRPTNLPWGVHFPEGSPAFKEYGSRAVHPSQLYEAILGLIMFGILLLYRHKRPNRAYGELFALQMTIYGIGRFFLEYMRGDDIRGIFGPFSTSQWISVAMLVFAGCLFAWAQKFGERTPAVAK